MSNISFGKKYLASCYNYDSEAIYLGKKLNKKLKNRHFFMIKHPKMTFIDSPIVVACSDFEIINENELNMEYYKMYFPKLTKNEKEFLYERYREHWKEEFE